MDFDSDGRSSGRGAGGRGWGNRRGGRQGSWSRGAHYSKRRNTEDGVGGGGRDGYQRRPSGPFRGGRRGGHRGEQQRENNDHRSERGRHSGRGRGRGRLPHYFSQRWRGAAASVDVRELADLDPDDLVKRVNEQLKEVQEAFGRPNTPMDVVAQILSKVFGLARTRDAEEQGTAAKIIAEILSERSETFHFQLKRSVQSNECTLEQAERFCSLFKSLLTFESLARDCLPIDELQDTVKRLTKAGTTHSNLLKIAEELRETRDQMRAASTVKTESESVDNDERDDSSFKQIPILPEWKEINEDKGTPPEVRPNQIDTPYKDWMQYYDIQFRLIREDFIAAL